jgi:predicted signal transduction protein with EAL and GGDEF domain
MQSSLKAIRLEVSDYLEKPLSLASVKDAIERGLKRREMLRKSIENKAYQNLLSDSLTGLPDRSQFLDRLNGAIAAIDRHEDRSFAVLLIGIDDFKSVNDIYGHQTGDMVLTELANRFKSCVRATDDMRLVGLEALIRWNHPELGLIYSNEFIPKAEEIGLINQMGNWVLSEGCRQIKEWQSTLSNFEGIYLSINIAGQQVVQPGFAEMAAAIIHQHYLDPETLKLELAESVLMENSGSLTENLSVMKNKGFKLAIDDFGTGYSTFSYLRQFSIDDLKIDNSFIQQLAADPETYEIVKSIVGLAKKLGLNVVAEGVNVIPANALSP